MRDTIAKAPESPNIRYATLRANSIGTELRMVSPDLRA
jgi:hypothetical protein